MELDTELKYYESHKADLLQAYRGQVVVISGEALLGVFPTEEEAYQAAVLLTHLSKLAKDVRKLPADKRSAASDASTSSSTTPASSDGRAFRRLTRRIWKGTSPCTSPARSAPPGQPGRTWSSRATAES